MSVYSIDFTLPVNFTDHTGVTFENITTGEIVTPTTTFENSPSKLLSYTDVNWITPPVENDVVHYKYDGLGNYNDGPPDNNLMEAQTFNIVNCLGVLPTVYIVETGTGLFLTETGTGLRITQT